MYSYFHPRGGKKVDTLFSPLNPAMIQLKGTHMAEIVTTYALDKLSFPEPMDRDQFYHEQIAAFKNTGKPTRAVGIINVFLFNTEGELLVQQRSNHKKHNPGLLDKSIGGHMLFGDSPDYTVMVETVQELQVPSIVLKSNEEFIKTLKLLNHYLTTVALMKQVISGIHVIDKIFEGERVPIANQVYVYLGVYDGRTRAADKEAKGILHYTLDDIQHEMQTNPNKFTPDMHVLLKILQPTIADFMSIIKQ